MRILWIVNITFPEAISLMDRNVELKGSGGWLTALADALLQSGNIELHVASISDRSRRLNNFKGEAIYYHIIPLGKGDSRYNTQYEDYYRLLYSEIQPDVVHIHGTEYPHSLAALRACGSNNTVVSIQGLISIIARYYRGGITTIEALKNITFHDILRGGIIRQEYETFNLGKYEETLLKEVKYVIGRTSFDRQHTWALNPNVYYFHCVELLRNEFYKSKSWKFSECKTHSIFISQAAFPIKGLHVVIKALKLVICQYPDVQIRVAGQDITCRGGGLKNKLRITGYGKIIKKLILKNRLENNIIFTGPLNADDMVREYLSANLFLCPSSIENSPNSLAEAQLLGVPCIGAYVGGIPDMMKGQEQHLYRFDDVEMLAYKICEAFEKYSTKTSTLISTDNNKFGIRRDCVNDTLKIYKEIIRYGKE